jgi:hypothetical protein
MKRAICIGVVLLALTCSSAWAQLVIRMGTARELGMGGVGVAIADDAAAAYQNPAGLACLGISGDPGQSFVNDVAATYLNGNAPLLSATLDALTWAGFSPGSGWGLGAYGAQVDASPFPLSAKFYGIGVGKALWNTRFTFGLNLSHFDLGPGTGANTFTGGVLFGRPGDRLKVGLRIADLTQKLDDMSFDAGLAWQINSRLLLAADGINITEASGGSVWYNAGAEYAINPRWTARLGVVDVSDTARWSGGLGFRKDSWRLDAGYLNDVESTLWSLTGGVTF